ncbi:hypothetical protein E2C01_000317 [Portunus trituberculatus]|uniref:Uncharacterized protein n=1 Tax=Portunus trituberculatus TaxID=210409 RepID=A0A5B7CG63_PORTR|nr:hypothetical protein [Portunus trituberculatus]
MGLAEVHSSGCGEGMGVAWAPARPSKARGHSLHYLEQWSAEAFKYRPRSQSRDATGVIRQVPLLPSAAPHILVVSSCLYWPPSITAF